MTAGTFEIDVIKVFQKHLLWKAKTNRSLAAGNLARAKRPGSGEDAGTEADGSPRQAAESAELPQPGGEPPVKSDSQVLQRMRELVSQWREDGRIVAETLDSSIRFSAAYEVFAADLERELDELSDAGEDDR